MTSIFLNNNKMIEKSYEVIFIFLRGHKMQSEVKMCVFYGQNLFVITLS